MKTFNRYALSFLGSLLTTVAILAAPAHAQDRVSEIDKMFNWAVADCPGCAVAVSLNGELIVNRAYGAADLEHKTAITPNTILDAGSLQKQFVAAAVLVL